MGSAQSTTESEAISIITQNMTNITQSTTNKSAMTCDANNDMIVNIDNSTCGSITEGQTINGTCNLSSFFTTSNASDISNIINNAIQQATTSSNSAVNGFLDSSVSYQNTNMSLSTALQNFVTTNVTQIVTNSCVNNALFTNASTVTVSNSTIPGVCDFSQAIQFSAACECIVNSATSAIANNSEINTAVQSASATQASTGGGVADVISALTSGWALILFGLGFAAIAGGVAYYVITRKKTPSSSASSTSSASTLMTSATEDRLLGLSTKSHS